MLISAPGGCVVRCRLEYCDEAVRDPSQTVPVDIHQPPAFLHKILQLSSVQLLYETTGGPQVAYSFTLTMALINPLMYTVTLTCIYSHWVPI